MTSTNEAPAPAPPASLGTVIHAPLPEWVDHQAWPEAIDDPQGTWTDNGVLRILHDTQANLIPAGTAIHIRVVQRVLTRAGAERAAQVFTDFDPTHERIEIHHLRVWRGSTCIEHAAACTEAQHLLRREKQLERLALNGRLTATLLIPDVRVDDRIEIAMTQYANNPVLAGRYLGWLVFNSYGPWIESRQRLLRPLSRPVQLKPFNDPPVATAQTSGEVEESRWSLLRQERRTPEDLLPSWTIKSPCYQVSEFRDWREVVEIFEPHYAAGVLPEDLALELDQLAAAHPGDTERAVEWLRYVQRSIRYFTLSLGEGGLVPRSVEAIWSGRFGDCKDAARLYVAGARRLGLDAVAALVSTTHGLSIDQFLPSTQAFNHMIVRLRLGATTYWLDPTLQAQGGTLDKIVQPHAGWALPVTADATALEPLPAAQPLEHLCCHDEIQVGSKTDSPATLRRRLELTCWSADNVRHRIGNEGGAKLAAQLLQDLQATWPRIVETFPMTITDDLAENRLTLQFGYEIPEIWKPAGKRGRWELHLADNFTIKELSALKTVRRSSEIFMGRPRSSLWRARLLMPRRWRGTGWRNVSGDRGALLRNELTIDARAVELQRVLVIDTWTLPADRAEAYVQLVGDIGRNATRLYGRAFFGRIHSAVGVFADRGLRIGLFTAVWFLAVALPAMCSHL